MHLDPYRVDRIASALTARLSTIDAANAAGYDKRHKAFSDQWQTATKQWEQHAAPLKGMKVIAYHSSFNYLFEWLGVEKVGDLEPKPGLPPSAKHLESLLALTKTTPVNAIVYAYYQDKRGAQWLSKKTGIPVVQLPLSVNEQQKTLMDLYNTLIQSLLAVNSKR